MVSIVSTREQVNSIQYYVKRFMDYTIALSLLVLSAPIFLIISLLIYAEDRGSIFYVQKRVGLNGRLFSILKFRSMVVEADKLLTVLEVHNESKDGVLFKIKSSDPRITKVGSFIRKWSIDELPQLINILRGEMSLIGPRCLSIRDWERTPLQYRDRVSVHQGLTGLWQVSDNRWDMDFNEVYDLDKYYIDNWNLWLDFQILLRTVMVVLNRKNS